MAGDDKLEAISFAAGTAAAFMVCIGRAVVVWRVWVFLALNLLLLAILLIAKFQTPPVCKKRARPECEGVVSPHDAHSREVEKRKPILLRDEEDNGGDGDDDDTKEDEDQLSKEELHQRVEAFITMFRQHLVSDAAKTVSMKSNMLNSSLYLSSIK